MNCLNQYNSVLYKPTLTVIYLPMPTRANICSWRIILFHTLQRGFLSRLMNSSLAPASHTLKGRVSLSYMFVVSWSLGCTCLPLRKHAKGDLVDRIIFDFFLFKNNFIFLHKAKMSFPSSRILPSHLLFLLSLRFMLKISFSKAQLPGTSTDVLRKSAE